MNRDTWGRLLLIFLLSMGVCLTSTGFDMTSPWSPLVTGLGGAFFGLFVYQADKRWRRQ